MLAILYPGDDIEKKKNETSTVELFGRSEKAMHFNAPKRFRRSRDPTFELQYGAPNVLSAMLINYFYGNKVIGTLDKPVHASVQAPTIDRFPFG